HVRRRFEARALCVAHGEGRAFVAARARVVALLVDRVVLELEERPTLVVEKTLLGHRDDALHDLHERCLRRHSLAHELYGEKRTADFDVCLTATGRTGGADVVVAVLARTDDRRVADAPRDLP